MPAAHPTHWLHPIDPARHTADLDGHWRTAPAADVWAAIGRSQPLDRWCLRNGHRTMRPGDTIWAYLSRRQEICAVGAVRAVVPQDDIHAVLVDWDADATAALCAAPIPRAEFGQIPMSTCRARPDVAALLEDRHPTRR